MTGTKGAMAMRLRAEPPRVTRLSRRILAGICGVVLLGIGGVLIYALQTRDAGQGTRELYPTDNRPTADGLSELPSDYTGPVLGPALPGDLGRPILDAQQRGQPVTAPVIATPGVDPDGARRRAEEEAARLSGVFFQNAQGSRGADTMMPDVAGPLTHGQAASGDRHADFLSGPVDRQTVAPGRLVEPASPYVLQAGAVIPAALITGIRSDLPGQITAQVTENVYDSPTGGLLLIPQGTRIVGEYDAGVTSGQRRILLVWNRLILPDGRSIVLDRLPGADVSGHAGLEDGVDHHWWDLMRAAGLSTLLAVGTEFAAGDGDGLVGAMRDGAQDTIIRTGDQLIQRQLQVAPTLTIRPGHPVRVIVTRDLVLEPRES